MPTWGLYNFAPALWVPLLVRSGLLLAGKARRSLLGAGAAAAAAWPAHCSLSLPPRNVRPAASHIRGTAPSTHSSSRPPIVLTSTPTPDSLHDSALLRLYASRVDAVNIPVSNFPCDWILVSALSLCDIFAFICTYTTFFFILGSFYTTQSGPTMAFTPRPWTHGTRKDFFVASQTFSRPVIEWTALLYYL